MDGAMLGRKKADVKSIAQEQSSRRCGSFPEVGEASSDHLPLGEGDERIRHSAGNGPERSEGAQGKIREPGEGSGPVGLRQSLVSDTIFL